MSWSPADAYKWQVASTSSLERPSRQASQQSERERLNLPFEIYTQYGTLHHDTQQYNIQHHGTQQYGTTQPFGIPMAAPRLPTPPPLPPLSNRSSIRSAGSLYMPLPMLHSTRWQPDRAQRSASMHSRQHTYSSSSGSSEAAMYAVSQSPLPSAQVPTQEQREHALPHAESSSMAARYSSSHPYVRTPPQHPLTASGLTRTRSYSSDTELKKANRQKSKRHYERKREQRDASSDLMAAMVEEVERLQRSDEQASRANITQQVRHAIELRLPVPLESVQSGNTNAVPDSNMRGNDSKRRNKVMQRHHEVQRIEQLTRIALALEGALASTALESPDANSRAVYALLQPWLRCQDLWPHLLHAEARLSVVDGHPLARLTSSLRSSSSAYLMQARE